MARNQSLRRISLFLASPGDVAEARHRAQVVVAELNQVLSQYFGIFLDPREWSQAVPGMGRPEAVILEQMPVDDWDLFVGVLWVRFGMPTGGNNPVTGEVFESGTEEEFQLANESWKSSGRPRILLYRCTEKPDLDRLSTDQLAKVQRFFKEFNPRTGKHPGLYREYVTADDFERQLRMDLLRLLIQQTKDASGPDAAAIAEAMQPAAEESLPTREPFFGRAQELERILKTLDPADRAWGIVLNGAAGIGKTALALEAAYTAREHRIFDRVIWVTAKADLRSPADPDESALKLLGLQLLFENVARSLGRSVAQLADGDAQRNAIRQALLHQRILLVFDNLEALTEEDQLVVSQFLRYLPSGCKAIVTTRKQLPDAPSTLWVQRLTLDEARQLINDQAHRHPTELREVAQAGDEGWSRFYHESGGSPLAILWTLGLIRRQGHSFSDALVLLQEGNDEAGLPEFVFRAAVERMSKLEKLALYALSLFGGPAGVEALSQTVEVEPAAVLSVLDQLITSGLVKRQPPGESGDSEEAAYSLLPVTQHLSRSQLRSDVDPAGTVAFRFATYWYDFARENGGDAKDNYQAYIRLNKNWENVSRAASTLWSLAQVHGDEIGNLAAGEVLIELARAVQDYLWFAGHLEERVLLSSHAHHAAVASKRWEDAGWAAYRVAITHANRANLDELSLWTERCTTAWKMLEPDKRREVVCLVLRGKLASLQQDDAKAVKTFEEALLLSREAGNRRDVLAILIDLGDLLRQQGQYGPAGERGREALAIAVEIEDVEGEGAARLLLGDLAVEQDEGAQAREQFLRAQSIAQEVGRVAMIARAEAGLARLLEREGQVEAALSCAKSALAIYERLRHPRLEETRTLTRKLEVEVASG
jgi:tetratricopeptide (TPR) repeat protein